MTTIAARKFVDDIHIAWDTRDPYELTATHGLCDVDEDGLRALCDDTGDLAETDLDLTDEIEAARAVLWAEQTGRTTTPQAYSDEPDFLDPDSDYRSGPQYDAVFERPSDRDRRLPVTASRE